jgi:phosphatidylinositol alpha-1,6-mannosyltransferase
MKILALLTDGLGGHGGIAQYNRDFMRAVGLIDSVESVRILPRHPEARVDLPDRKVSQEQPWPGRIGYSLQALALALRYKPDLIFCGHLYMAPLAWLLSRVLQKQFWLQLHGIEAWRRPGVLTRVAAERASLVTAVSRHTRRRFLSWANISAHRCLVLPNAIDTGAFGPGSKSPQLLDRYGLRGKKVLMTLGRLAAEERYKGFDEVLDVLSALEGEHPGVVYLIAGEGTDRPRLEREAHRRGLATKVIFSGFVAAEEKADHFRIADIFVMPSSGEGFGIVLLEALASGLPVIAGDRDGARDALRDGTDGQLVTPGDTMALGAAIRRALSIAPAQAQPSVFRFDNFARAIRQMLEGRAALPDQGRI